MGLAGAFKGEDVEAAAFWFEKHGLHDRDIVDEAFSARRRSHYYDVFAESREFYREALMRVEAFRAERGESRLHFRDELYVVERGLFRRYDLVADHLAEVVPAFYVFYESFYWHQVVGRFPNGNTLLFVCQ